MCRNTLICPTNYVISSMHSHTMRACATLKCCEHVGSLVALFMKSYIIDDLRQLYNVYTYYTLYTQRCTLHMLCWKYLQHHSTTFNL